MATVLKRFSGRMQKRNTSLVYTTKNSTHTRANKHTCLFITSVRLLLFLCPPHAKHQMGQACRLQQVRLPPSRQPKHLTSVVLTPSQGITPHRRTSYILHTPPSPTTFLLSPTATARANWGQSQIVLTSADTKEHTNRIGSGTTLLVTSDC